MVLLNHENTTVAKIQNYIFVLKISLLNPIFPVSLNQLLALYISLSSFLCPPTFLSFVYLWILTFLNPKPIQNKIIFFFFCNNKKKKSQTQTHKSFKPKNHISLPSLCGSLHRANSIEQVPNHARNRLVLCDIPCFIPTCFLQCAKSHSTQTHKSFI